MATLDIPIVRVLLGRPQGLQEAFDYSIGIALKVNSEVGAAEGSEERETAKGECLNRRRVDERVGGQPRDKESFTRCGPLGIERAEHGDAKQGSVVEAVAALCTTCVAPQERDSVCPAAQDDETASGGAASVRRWGRSSSRVPESSATTCSPFNGPQALATAGVWRVQSLLEQSTFLGPVDRQCHRRSLGPESQTQSQPPSPQSSASSPHPDHTHPQTKTEQNGAS